MLKRVRCRDGFTWTRNVHWQKALAAATSIAASAPTRRSAAKSIAYDTDIVAPLVVSGRLTLNADAAEESTRRTRTRSGS